MCVQAAEPYVEPPNDVDVEMAISKLQMEKQLGMIKSQPKLLKKEEETIPYEWKYGIICPIHKKWVVMMCGKFRAVTLFRTTYKILANILYVKVVPYVEEIIGETEEAFNGEDQLLITFFTMREILEKCWEQYRCTSSIY